MPETTTTPTKPQPDVLMRFLTQGGAEVHVTRNGTYTQHGFNGRSWNEQRNRWTCHGCDKGSDPYDRYPPNTIRDAANTHAQNCRSMPKPTPAA
ncbi:hypothetical protein ACFW9D_05480 [Streptomyces sp. NPDC059524]|uniref:hypothetical protein n=1 Tax=Streptomyces sp. NPDC059524 TaxID=3346856 RepID=UPI003698E31A